MEVAVYLRASAPKTKSRPQRKRCDVRRVCGFEFLVCARACLKSCVEGIFENFSYVLPKMLDCSTTDKTKKDAFYNAYFTATILS